MGKVEDEQDLGLADQLQIELRQGDAFDRPQSLTKIDKDWLSAALLHKFVIYHIVEEVSFTRLDLAGKGSY